MWYLTDKLGSVRENVNSSGSVIDSITYDTYGNILAETAPSSGDRFKYTSREWDSEIGQYFYRARYYSPGIGRFESEDPIGFNGGDPNFYRYVFNSVTSLIDPRGLDGVTPFGKGRMSDFGRIKPPKPKPLTPCEKFCGDLWTLACGQCAFSCPDTITKIICIAAQKSALEACLAACLPPSGGGDNQEAGREAFDEVSEPALAACDAKDLKEKAHLPKKTKKSN
jgi:RHS repeat-associated protein